jgi:hypothetical protein
MRSGAPPAHEVSEDNSQLRLRPITRTRIKATLGNPSQEFHFKDEETSLEVRGHLPPLIALAVAFAVAQNNNIKQVLHAIVVIGKLCGTTATGGVLAA